MAPFVAHFIGVEHTLVFLIPINHNVHVSDLSRHSRGGYLGGPPGKVPPESRNPDPDLELPGICPEDPRECR